MHFKKLTNMRLERMQLRARNYPIPRWEATQHGVIHIGLGTTYIGLGTNHIGLGTTHIGLGTTHIGLGTTQHENKQNYHKYVLSYKFGTSEW